MGKFGDAIPPGEQAVGAGGGHEERHARQDADQKPAEPCFRALDRQVIEDHGTGEDQGNAVMFPSPLAEKQHAEDDEAELGGEGPAGILCLGS